MNDKYELGQKGYARFTIFSRKLTRGITCYGTINYIGTKNLVFTDTDNKDYLIEKTVFEFPLPDTAVKKLFSSL